MEDIVNEILEKKVEKTPPPTQKRHPVKLDLKREIERLSGDTPDFVQIKPGIDAQSIELHAETAKQVKNVKSVTVKNFVSWARNIIDGGVVQLRRTIVFSRRELTFYTMFEIPLVNEHEFIVQSAHVSNRYHILKTAQGTLLTDEFYNVLYMTAIQTDMQKIEKMFFDKKIKFTNYYYFKPVCVRECMVFDPTRVWNIFTRRLDREIFLDLPIEKLDESVIELAKKRFDTDSVSIVESDDNPITTEYFVLKFTPRYDDFTGDEDYVFDLIDRLDQLVDPNMLTFVARIYPIRGLVFKII